MAAHIKGQGELDRGPAPSRWQLLQQSEEPLGFPSEQILLLPGRGLGTGWVGTHTKGWEYPLLQGYRIPLQAAFQGVAAVRVGPQAPQNSQRREGVKYLKE